ncbi:MAG: hypothetical protein PHV30_11925 [Candidatus Margulisbacteria bacterium]|nr:hypothetical protein [Candidatus Margulisiibacteriota bacterium]
MVQIIFFIGVSILIIFSYALLLQKKLTDTYDLLLGSFVWFSLQIIVTQAALGLLGKLDTFNLFLTNFLISLPIICYSWQKIHWRITSIEAVSSIKNIRHLLFFQFILVSYGFIVFLGWLIPPYGWDSITYHLPTVFHWVQEKRIFIIQPLCATSFFPMNGSLFMMWLYLGSKSLNLLNLTQVPFALMLSLATYSLARKLNIHDAIIVIPLVLLTPAIMLLCSVAYVDVIFSCFIILVLNFVVGYSKTKETYLFLLSCTVLGIASGIKPGGFWLLVAVFLLCYVNRKQLSPQFLTAGVLLAFTGGGFWYVRNFIITGNPVFPYEIKLFNITLLTGTEKLGKTSVYEQWFVNSRAEWLLYPLKEKIRGAVTYSIENGFGMQFVLGIVSLFYASYVSFKKKETLLFMILLCFPLTLALWFLTSTCPVPRYIIFLCSITAIAIAYVQNQLTGMHKKIMDALIIISLGFSFIVTLPILVPYQGKVLQAYSQFKTLPPFEYYRWIYGPIGIAWEWVENNVETGSVIACDYDNLTAPLFGRVLQHDVIHVVTYDTPYNGKPQAHSYEELRKIIQEYKISYIFTVIPA